MNERIKHLVEAGAIFLDAPVGSRALELANAAFQQMRASILPESLVIFYKSFGGAIFGDTCVFPLDDIERSGRNYIIPGIIQVNRKMAGFAVLRGRTVWGRNQFYLFSCDVAGNLYMHDVLTLQVLRKYTDFYVALTDCLLVGKI
ncbi:MAG: hypothetical protein LBD94_02555 [Rickettsiales bacterium]|jgi:hypothetical protein|nr:hypothetical protein [Rickettsiales bacterium]